MREREQRRGRSEGELRESERGRGERGGECVAPSGASSGEQVSRRWPELFGRAPRLASADWQRKKRTRGGRRWAGPAGGAGPATGEWPRWAAGNVSLPLSVFPILLLFSILFNFILPLF